MTKASFLICEQDDCAFFYRNGIEVGHINYKTGEFKYSAKQFDYLRETTEAFERAGRNLSFEFTRLHKTLDNPPSP